MNGRTIKDRRLARGWTQQQLADRARVSIWAVRRWEQGLNKPSRLAMLQLQKLLRAPKPPAPTYGRDES